MLQGPALGPHLVRPEPRIRRASIGSPSLPSFSTFSDRHNAVARRGTSRRAPSIVGWRRRRSVARSVAAPFLLPLAPPRHAGRVPDARGRVQFLCLPRSRSLDVGDDEQANVQAPMNSAEALSRMLHNGVCCTPFVLSTPLACPSQARARRSWQSSCWGRRGDDSSEAARGAAGRRASHDRKRRAAEQWIREGSLLTRWSAAPATRAVVNTGKVAESIIVCLYNPPHKHPHKHLLQNLLQSYTLSKREYLNAGAGGPR